MPKLLGLYGVENEFEGVNLGVLDPVNPQGPKIQKNKGGKTKCIQIKALHDRECAKTLIKYSVFEKLLQHGHFEIMKTEK